MIQGRSDLAMPFGQTRSHVYPDQAWIVSRRLQVCGCLLLYSTRATRVRQTQISNSKAPPRVNVKSKIVLASSAFGTPAPPQTYGGCKCRWRKSLHLPCYLWDLKANVYIVVTTYFCGDFSLSVHFLLFIRNGKKAATGFHSWLGGNLGLKLDKLSMKQWQI